MPLKNRMERGLRGSRRPRKKQPGENCSRAKAGLSDLLQRYIYHRGNTENCLGIFDNSTLYLIIKFLLSIEK